MYTLYKRTHIDQRLERPLDKDGPTTLIMRFRVVRVSHKVCGLIIMAGTHLVDGELLRDSLLLMWTGTEGREEATIGGRYCSRHTQERRQGVIELQPPINQDVENEA
jgi:hypothetical protein